MMVLTFATLSFWAAPFFLQPTKSDQLRIWMWALSPALLWAVGTLAFERIVVDDTGVHRYGFHGWKTGFIPWSLVEDVSFYDPPTRGRGGMPARVFTIEGHGNRIKFDDSWPGSVRLLEIVRDHCRD